MLSLKKTILCAVLAVPLLSFAATSPTIRIDTGQIEGRAEGAVESWKGIPFAQPPLGPLRWRAPQPAAPWLGVRQATAYAHDCMQLPVAGDFAPLGTPPDEDCLYLNVWRPAGANDRRPVIVWIYGGGFLNGGASPPIYSGANLAAKGVIFVSFNYRVGRFGTFAHPLLTREHSDDGLIGNYGYLDQIAALRWVQRNIASFGGDPSNVTVIGESAGGMSVLNLLTSALSSGLLAKAIVMSGGNGETMGHVDLRTAQNEGINFAQSAGIAPTDPQALVKLRALSAEQVTDGLNMLALMKNEQPRTFSSPFVDGRICVDVSSAVVAGAISRVPIMIGATSGDIGGETGYMVAGARALAKAFAQQGVPVYAYRFSYIPESLRTPANSGALHATDVPFFLDTQRIRYGDATTAHDDKMGKLISAYIVAFARSGDPNGEARPSWPRYDGDRDVLLDFTVDGAAVPKKDPLGARIDAAPPPRVSIPPPPDSRER